MNTIVNATLKASKQTEQLQRSQREESLTREKERCAGFKQNGLAMTQSVTDTYTNEWVCNESIIL